MHLRCFSFFFKAKGHSIFCTLHNMKSNASLNTSQRETYVVVTLNYFVYCLFVFGVLDFRAPWTHDGSFI